MELANPSSETPMSGNAESRYIRNHQYTKKLATSYYPDIHYNGYTQPATIPVGPGSHRYQEGEFVRPGFFKQIDPSIFALPQTEIEWTYNLRRAAQRILPFLYLGPWSCLSNKQWLKQEGISLLLGVRDQRLADSRLFSGQKAAVDAGAEIDSFDVVDNQDLIARLPQTIRRINDHIYPSVDSETGAPISRKILVFCETGNGLSALVVVAYCMVMLNMSLAQALNFIHSQRFCIDMEDGFKPMLLAFEGILEAKRDVENAKTTGANSNLAPPSVGLSKKRSFADQVEDKAMGDDNMDVDVLSLDRKPPAPFQDR
ncbi:protein-tyrosine phosphatase-like protein [Aspergillus aurantiobrunneus]